MWEFLQSIFDTSGYLPRWYCGPNWAAAPAWGWLLIVSDIAIWLAYSAIPVILLYLVGRQHKAMVGRLGLLFAAFILLCGLTHLIDAALFWYPIYRISGLVKAVTAIVSLATVVSLFVIVPKLRRFHSPEEADQLLKGRTAEITRLLERTEVDAAEIRRINDDLKASREILQLAMSIGESGSFDWDLKTGRTRVDAGFSKLTGLGLGSQVIQADEFFQRIPEENRAAVSQLVKQAVDENTAYEAHFPFTRVDGQRIWLSGKGLVIHDTEGRPQRLIGLNSDITEYIRREESLSERADHAARMSERKSRFIAQVSHEIRTPLTAMLGCIDTLMPDIRDSQARDVLRVVRSQGELLRILLNDVLDLSKVEAGKLELKIQNSLLAPVFASVCSLMDPLASEKGLRLGWHPKRKLPRSAQIDPFRMRQILLNLVHNAIKFTRKGSVEIVVDLDTSNPANAILITEVRDSGIGIPTERLERIFKEFEQVGVDMSGSGLGLTIANRLVSLMKGKLGVKSQSGLGSIFTIKIPIGSVEEADFIDFDRVIEDDVQNNDFELPKEILPLRVLVADDTRVIQFVIERMLSKMVRSFKIVSDGREAVTEAMAVEGTDQAFDVVLMDIQMPDVDGIEATRQLRREGFRKPIVILTAAATLEDRERSLAAGCNDFLLKPLPVDKVRSTLAKYVAVEPSGNPSGMDTINIPPDEI